MDELVRQGIALPIAVQIAVVISNLTIRLAAIGAGVYIAKLGHDTMVREVKGKFEYKSKFGELKANIPGPLFILLGTMAIGWALMTPVTGKIQLQLGADNPAAVETPEPPPFGRPE